MGAAKAKLARQSWSTTAIAFWNIVYLSCEVTVRSVRSLGR
jgi:hypothetical protein